MFDSYTHAYIIGYFNPSVSITTYLLIPLDTKQIFEKLFMEILVTLRVFTRNLLREEVAEEIFFSYFVLMPDLGYEPGLYA